jgi:hypothetical protein
MIGSVALRVGSGRFLISALVLAVAVPANAHQVPARSQQAWHVSPSNDPRSSTVYFQVDWAAMQKVKIGMPEKEVEAILGMRLQFYHHPGNAIVFSKTPEGKAVEIALKRGDSGTIEGISYKLRGNADDTARHLLD